MNPVVRCQAPAGSREGLSPLSPSDSLERSLSFAAAVDEFVRCATGNAPVRALRLLAPAIAHADLYTELVLGDAEAVDARLKKHPEAARRAGGIQNWEPLLYVCHTCLHNGAPERAAGLAAIACSLLARGGNPNAEYHWNWYLRAHLGCDRAVAVSNAH